jgi:SAM-dependent methyltransferase
MSGTDTPPTQGSSGVRPPAEPSGSLDWFAIVERHHDIQNPLSAGKVRLLGEYLRLRPGSEVLDVGCGKAAPARILAAAFGCRVRGIELRETFAAEGREKIRAAGLDALVSIETANAAELELDASRYDAALCLGASFIWGHLGDTAAALEPVVRPGGFLAIGEPYWRVWPLPAGVEDEGYVTLEQTANRLADAGLRPTGVIASSEDDWDGYESPHWRAAEEWLAEHPDHEEAAAVRARHERSLATYLGSQRSLLGWAVFVARKP